MCGNHILSGSGAAEQLPCWVCRVWSLEAGWCRIVRLSPFPASLYYVITRAQFVGNWSDFNEQFPSSKRRRWQLHAWQDLLPIDLLRLTFQSFFQHPCIITHSAGPFVHPISYALIRRVTYMQVAQCKWRMHGKFDRKQHEYYYAARRPHQVYCQRWS